MINFNVSNPNDTKNEWQWTGHKGVVWRHFTKFLIAIKENPARQLVKRIVHIEHNSRLTKIRHKNKINSKN